MKTIHDPRYRRAIGALKQARFRSQLTQKEVCRQLGWHRTRLSNIERLQRRADLIEVYELARVFGITMNVIVKCLVAKNSSKA